MTKRMIEFFSGTGRMAQAFRDRGYHAVTVDKHFKAEGGQHYFYDILLNINSREDVIRLCGGEPDVMWFGTPCEGFSVAVIGRNWDVSSGRPEPKTDSARVSVALAKKCLEIISWFPNAVYGIENPRGMLRKMDFMAGLPRRTVTYCKFGERRMKPTDIWTNVEGWDTPDPCKNGDTCHDAAPRGSRTGTQGLKTAYDRSAYPVEFCRSFASAVSRDA